MKVLVTGCSGLLGQLVTKALVRDGHQVVGIDKRPFPDAPEGVTVYQADIRKRAAEDVFRDESPEGVIHMATVSHLHHRGAERFRVNLQGTRAVVDACARYGAKRFVFVGRHTYYGAAPDAPLYHTEDEPPMGLAQYPELADLVAADLFAGTALWRHPEIETTVLRLVYTLGASRHGTLASYLGGQRVPTVLGFDPLFHFLHERDAADAIALAMKKSPRGVFNVAGPPPLPLSALIEACGRQPVPVPEPMLNLTLGRFGLAKLPKGAQSHLKFPIVVDAAPFRKATGFQHAYDEREAIRAFAD